MSFLSSLMNALPGAVAQGLAWGIMAIGVYITFRILDVADLTVDGSLATGGAVCVMLIRAGVNPWLAMLCALVSGMLAVSVGAIVYYIVLQVVLQIGLNTNDLKLITALIVAIFLTLSYLNLKKTRRKPKPQHTAKEGVEQHA